ncbi:MAG TPA: GNAT family protein [Ktedonobacterales bacterium]|nr:GNAT family protein [Ktedonobacterales bacterium]
MSIDVAFTSFPVLTTDRLRLRQIRPTDAEALFAIRSDPEVREPYGREPQQSLAESQTFIQSLQATYERRDGLFWGITRKDEDTVIGSCNFWNLSEDFLCAEVGYELHRAHWRQGIMAEAVSAILAYGFTELGFHRIEAGPFVGNAASKQLLLKLGFTYEGTLRQRVFFRDHFLDQEYYGLLEDEWSSR